MNQTNLPKKLLSLGIPTYKRPEYAVRLIKKAISMNIYDEIIVSSNSKEEIFYSILWNSTYWLAVMPFSLGAIKFSPFLKCAKKFEVKLKAICLFETRPEKQLSPLSELNRYALEAVSLLEKPAAIE